MAMFSPSPGALGQRRPRMQRSTLANPAAQLGRVGRSYGPFANPAVFIPGMHNTPNPARNAFDDYSYRGNEPNGGMQLQVDLPTPWWKAPFMQQGQTAPPRPKPPYVAPGAKMVNVPPSQGVPGAAAEQAFRETGDRRVSGAPVSSSAPATPQPEDAFSLELPRELGRDGAIQTGWTTIPPRPVPDPMFQEYELEDGTKWTPGTPMLPPLQGQPRPQAPQEAPDPVADQIRLIEQRRAARQSLHDRNMGQIQQGAVSGLGLPGDMSLPSSPLSQADQARVNQIRADGRLAFGGLDNFTQRWRRIAAAGQQDEQAAAPGRISGMGTRPTPAAPTGTVLPGQMDTDAPHRARLQSMIDAAKAEGRDTSDLEATLAQYQPGDANWRNSPETRRAHLQRMRDGTLQHAAQGPNLNDPEQRQRLHDNLAKRADMRQRLMDGIAQGRQRRIDAARDIFLRRNPVLTLGGDIGQLAGMGAIGMDAGTAANVLRNRDQAAFNRGQLSLDRDRLTIDAEQNRQRNQQTDMENRIGAYAVGAQLFPNDPEHAAAYAEDILAGGPLGVGANAPPPTRAVGGATGGGVGMGAGAAAFGGASVPAGQDSGDVLGILRSIPRDASPEDMIDVLVRSGLDFKDPGIRQQVLTDLLRRGVGMDQLSLLLDDSTPWGLSTWVGDTFGIPMPTIGGPSKVQRDQFKRRADVLRQLLE